MSKNVSLLIANLFLTIGLGAAEILPQGFVFTKANFINELSQGIVIHISDGVSVPVEIYLEAGERSEKKWENKLKMPLEYSVENKNSTLAGNEIIRASSGIAAYDKDSKLIISVTSELKVITKVDDKGHTRIESDK